MRSLMDIVILCASLAGSAAIGLTACAGSSADGSSGDDGGGGAPSSFPADTPDAGLHAPEGGGGTLGSDGGAAASCDTTLDRQGCSCSPGSPPRRCYTGPASQAGVGACTMGQQTCTAQGEFGVWGPCVGSGAPATCASAGQCGAIKDGCGGILDCGKCPAGEACGGGGQANVCGAGVCTPTTKCATLGAACGTVTDNCGNALDCGTCPTGQTCGGRGTANQCGCTPTTCAALGDDCGTVPDGCGGTLNCGTCASPKTCGGGGVAHQCGQPPCVPKTCATAGGACGSVPDGCGGTLTCTGGSNRCGALQDRCFAPSCGSPFSSNGCYTSTDTQLTPDGCQAWCNCQPGTVCCQWLTDSTHDMHFCYAITDATCATNRACSPSDPTKEGQWSVVCQ